MLNFKPTIIIITIILLLFIFYGKKYINFLLKNRLYNPIGKSIKLNNIDYNDIYINCKSGNEYRKPPKDKHEYINLWYLNKFENMPVVLYFHGNQYNNSYRQYMIDICNILKLNLLLVDYRGYGKSKGIISPNNILKDAELSYNFLIKNKHKSKNIIIWGESLGGTPACYIASKYNIKALILLSTFSSLHNLMYDINNIVRDSAFWVIRMVTNEINQLTNNEYFISKVKSPLCILHSTEDTLISYDNALKLYQSCNSSCKNLIPIKGEHDGPKITYNDFKQVVQLLELSHVTNTDLQNIINIIDELSYIANNSSTHDG